MSKTSAAYKDREAWLRERKTGLGGSDAAAIMGLNPYRTPLDVYRDKMGLSEEIEVNADMRRGNVLEPVAAEEYAAETGREIRRQPLRRHPEFPWMIANVDRQVFAGSGEGSFKVETTGVLEIKCPGIYTFAQIKRRGLPDHMTLQIIHYLAVTGYEWGSFALFNSERMDLLHFDIQRDDDLIETLIERERAFWHDHVLAEIPPEETVEEEIEIPEFTSGEFVVIENDSVWNKAAKDLREATELMDAAKALKDQASDRIKSMMDEHEHDAVEIPGLARFYYRSQDGRVSWKSTAQALAKEANLDITKFEVVGKSFRTFRTYFDRKREE